MLTAALLILGSSTTWFGARAQTCPSFGPDYAIEVTEERGVVCEGYNRLRLTISGMRAPERVSGCRLEFHAGFTPDFAPTDETFLLSRSFADTYGPGDLSFAADDFLTFEDCGGTLYLRGVVNCSSGPCEGDVVGAAVGRVPIRCSQRITLRGDVTACPGRPLPPLEVVGEDVTSDLTFYYRLGEGNRRQQVTVPSGATSVRLPAGPLPPAGGAPVPVLVEPFSLGDEIYGTNGGCDVEPASEATVRRSDDPACGDCDPPAPGGFGPQLTAYCTGRTSSGPLVTSFPGEQVAGYETVFLLFDADFERTLIADLGTEIPTYEEIFETILPRERFLVVARSRSVTDPDCYIDSEPHAWVAVEFDDRIIALCPGETETLPDGTVVSLAQPHAEYFERRPAPECDVAVRVTVVERDPYGIGLCDTPPNTCTPPEPRAISNVRTAYCAPLMGALPFALAPTTPGFEEVLLLYDGTFVTANGLLRDFGTRTPDWGEVFATDGLPPTFSLVVRRRSLTDPDCFVDARPYVLEPDFVRAVRFVDVCAGGEVILPDGTALSEARRAAEYVSPGPGDCDTLVNAIAEFVSAPTGTTTVTVCDGGRYELPDGTFLDADRPEATYTRPAPGGACDSVITARAEFGAPPVDTTVFLCPGEVFLLPPYVNDPRVIDEDRPTATYTRPLPSGCTQTVRVAADFSRASPPVDTVVNLCPGETFPLPDGAVLSEADRTGRYVRAVPGATCGRYVNVTAVYGEPIEAERSVALCTGETFALPDGTALSESRPTATYRVAGAGGACDSVVTVRADFGPAPAPVDTLVRLCAGGSFTLPNGLSLTEATPRGAYTRPVAESSCPQEVTVTASFSPPLARAEGVEVCAGGDYRLPNGTILSADAPTGAYVAAGTDGACDTTVTVTLTEVPRLTDTRAFGECGQISAPLPDGTVLDADRETATYTAGGVDGACDTLVTAVFVGGALVQRRDTIDLCDGERRDLPGATYVDASRPEVTYLLESGDPEVCPTLVTAVARFAPPVREERVGEIICPGGVVTVGGEGFGESRPEGVVTVAGESGCDSVRYVVTVAVAPAPLLGPPDTLTAALGQELTLRPQPGLLATQWPDSGDPDCDGCPNPTITATGSRNYVYAYVDGAGCTRFDSVYLEVRERVRPPRLFLPTAFSPDGDGVNDVLRPYASEGAGATLTLRVFDRWGGLLYGAEGVGFDAPEASWDGTSAGKPLDGGVYVVTAVARWPDGREAEATTGVTLMR